MTPAEKLAKQKPKRRRKDGTMRTRKAVWRCGLLELRENLGLSLTDVAKAIGMCVETVWQAENGADVKLSTAQKLAVLYGFPVDDIWPYVEVENE